MGRLYGMSSLHFLSNHLNHPMLSDRCLSVCLSVCPLLSVCNVGILWPNGWIDQDETWHGGRSQPWPHYARWRPSSPKGGTAPNFRTMYCGRLVAHLTYCWALVMAALWNRAGHYSFILLFVLSIFLFFSAPQCSHCKHYTSYSNSVRLSVCLSYAGIVSKWLHVARCSLHCQIAKICLVF